MIGFDTDEQRREAMSLASELPAIKARLGQAGLLRTMQQMELAVQEIGFEIAEKAAVTDQGEKAARDLSAAHETYLKRRRTA